MDPNISRSGRVRKSNPLFRDYKLFDDADEFEKMVSLDEPSDKRRDISKFQPHFGSESSPPETSKSEKKKEYIDEYGTKVRKADMHVFEQFKLYLRKDYIKCNRKLTDKEFGIVLKREWETMNNHEKRLWRRRATRVVTKRAVMKEEAYKRKSAVPPRAFPTFRTRLNANPSGGASYLFLAAKKLQKLGEKLGAQADQEVADGQNDTELKGSLSEILDTLLAAMSSLVSLTTQCPNLDVIPRDRLAETHNNVVAIMKNYPVENSSDVSSDDQKTDSDE